MISTVKSPPPPFSKGGRPPWFAVCSNFPLLKRGIEGDFHARGRQHFSVMNVYETVKLDGPVKSQISHEEHEDHRDNILNLSCIFFAPLRLCVFAGKSGFYEFVTFDDFVNAHAGPSDHPNA